MVTRSEKSAAAIVAAGMERRAKREGVFYAMSMCEALRQMPERSGRVPLADGEAGRASASDEATRPRHETGSTGSALLMAASTPVAEEEQHHPDMTISYNNLGVELSTHAIGGLSENDFILAAKIDEIKK